MPSTQLQLLTRSLNNMVRHALCVTPETIAIVIFDTEASLARMITEAYRVALPHAQFVEFTSIPPEQIKQLFNKLQAGDLVVLVQSTNFRLNEFRIRLELFQRGLKTIEHTHLNRMPPSQEEIYIQALEYDPAYYGFMGRALKQRLDTAQRVVVECADTTLTYTGPMEPAKLNIGDYTGMKNVGGTFPIGEVFTEPRDLCAVNGTARVFAFAGDDHLIRTYDPFLVTITDGILTAPQAPVEFQTLLEKIREDEDTVVREFGLGLNRAMNKHRIVSDITAFERQQGLHLSIGAKHAIYPKPGFHRKHGRYHVDIFVDAERITIDREGVYAQGVFSLNEVK
jgi:aminopeptidase